MIPPLMSSPAFHSQRSVLQYYIPFLRTQHLNTHIFNPVAPLRENHDAMTRGRLRCRRSNRSTWTL
jgi:hypothetical protein